MRPAGFSTGALAFGDFRTALQMLQGKPVDVIELSALRQHEVAPLLEACDSLGLSGFSYISVHAPSWYDAAGEPELLEQLEAFVQRGWPVVLHPDAAYDLRAWARFGGHLLIENMDKRKPNGRSMEELSRVFEQLPGASFCFDIGHARQFDPTMIEATLILKNFGPRLRQVHVSEVNTNSHHERLSAAAISAFQTVAFLIPDDIPLILETPISETEIETEIARAREALTVTRLVGVLTEGD